MSNSLKTLIDSNAKLWLYSIGPDLVAQAKADWARDATPNPIIVPNPLKSCRFNAALRVWMDRGLNDAKVAWNITVQNVSSAQAAFNDFSEQTEGRDRKVSFETDLLIEPLAAAEQQVDTAYVAVAVLPL
jgi:hypothetical protein